VYPSPTDLHSLELVQFTESAERVKRLLERGRRIEKFCFSKEQAEFELAEIESLLKQEKERCSWVRPIVNFYFLEKQNLKLGSQEGAAWKKLRNLFDDLSAGVEKGFRRLR